MAPAATTTPAPGLFDPGEIGGVRLRNRLVRSAVSETLADDRGVIRLPEYLDFYERLAEGGSGLLFTAHCFIEERGRYTPRMTGLTSVEHAAAFGPVTEAGARTRSANLRAAQPCGQPVRRTSSKRPDGPHADRKPRLPTSGRLSMPTARPRASCAARASMASTSTPGTATCCRRSYRPIRTAAATSGAARWRTASA